MNLHAQVIPYQVYICFTIKGHMKKLFDTDTRALRHQRCTRQSTKLNPSAFLHEQAANDLVDRIQSVKYNFKQTALIGDHLGIARQKLVAADIAPQTCLSFNDTLPLEQKSYDLIVDFMDLHHQNDPLGQLIQIRRALKPNGLFLSVMFGGRTLHQLRSSFLEAQTLVEGGVSPYVSPMADIRDIGGLLQRACYALPVVDADKIDVLYQTPLKLLHDLRYMGETNILTNRKKTFLRRETLEKMIEIYPCEQSTNHIIATFELLWMSGWSAHESQQKPLAPGSAKISLSDVLRPTL